MTDPRVTVVIPAADEERFIGACLDSVLAQDYEQLQVIVVDGASTDATAAAVRDRMKRDDRVELVHNGRRNIPSSLNLALAAAEGHWFVRVDAHCTIPPSYVARAVHGLAQGWSGVGGRKDGVGRTVAGRAIAVAMSSRLGVGNSTYHHGECRQEVDHLPFGAYPTQVLRDLGGWDERLTANEDFDLDYRLRKTGHHLLFDPHMSIAWHCRQSVADLYRQYVRYGRGKADVAWLHPASLQPRHLAPPAFIGYLAGACLIGLRRPDMAVAMTAPYATAVLGEAARQASRLPGAGERALVPAAIATMHVAWGVGFWCGTYANLRRWVRPDRQRPGTGTSKVATHER